MWVGWFQAVLYVDFNQFLDALKILNDPDLLIRLPSGTLSRKNVENYMQIQSVSGLIYILIYTQHSP